MITANWVILDVVWFLFIEKCQNSTLQKKQTQKKVMNESNAQIQIAIMKRVHNGDIKVSLQRK